MQPILVTGAGGQLGGIGHKVVESLLQHKLPVRAMVRTADQRAAKLREMGTEVVIGDLTNLEDTHRAISGCARVYFGWKQHVLPTKNLPPHVAAHLGTMALLHYQNRYDRHTDDVQKITGTPPTTITSWVRSQRAQFDRANQGQTP